MIDIEIKGIIEARKKMEQVVADLHGAPMLNAMRDATLMVQRDAKKNAPVDTGRLRASITPEIRMDGNDVVGVVGSNVAYSPFQELGTRAHWAPPGALDTWAKRHGMSAFVVMRAIAVRGIAPRRYLQSAFETNKPRIIARFDKAVREIVNK